MPTASVAYEARPRRRRAREDSQDDYLGRVRQTLMALGSNNPDGDLNATGEYWQKLKGQGIEPSVAGALVYATARHRHTASSQLREEARRPERWLPDEDETINLSDLLRGPGMVAAIGPERGSCAPGSDGVAKFASPQGSTRYIMYVDGHAASVLQVVSRDGRRATIANVYTVPAHRREGFAAQLLARARLDFETVEHASDANLSPAGRAWRGAVGEESPVPHEWEVVVRRTAAVGDIVAAAGRKPDEIGHTNIVFGDFYDDEKATAFARKMTKAGFIATSGARRQIAAEPSGSNPEDRPALRWAEVWWKDPSDAERFAKLLEKINGEVVATADNRIVTTNATAADIAKTIRKHRWKAPHSLTSSVQRYDKAAEGGGVRDEISESMARTLFVDAWSREEEQNGRHLHGDIFELAPETTPDAEDAARGLIRSIERENGETIEKLYARAAAAKGKHYRKATPHDFGYALAMQSLGHGVSWEDDHPAVPMPGGKKFKVPHIEFYLGMPRSNPLTEVAPCTRPHRTPVDSECAALAKSIGPIKSDKELYKLCAPRMRKEPQEVFYVVCVDVHGELCGFTEVARGQVSSVNVEPEQVLQAVLAIQPRPTGYAVSHQHPSGKAMPSAADRKLTEDIKRASAIACPNVAFLDHIIVAGGNSNEYYSFTEKKLKRA